MGNIPVGKVARAMKMAQAGVKVARNHAKHIAKTSLGLSKGRDELHRENARDLYKELGDLKGSALKMAQMLSQDQNILPGAYRDQFKMAQYSAPPLSFPLVKKVIRNEMGKDPLDAFDSFEPIAAHAASIGQVHIAYKNGKKLAVKVQYPGVAESIRSDLRLAKPFASRIFNLNSAEVDHYFSEVESKMLEETDYRLEARQGVEASRRLSDIPNLRFPKYYQEWSTGKVLVMEYLEGRTLDRFVEGEATQFERNRVGQSLWQVIDTMIREHQHVHADPHPGNFQVGENGELQMLDFGCMKTIPESFFTPFFSLMLSNVHCDSNELEKKLEDLELLLPQDTPAERSFYLDTYREFIMLLGRPFHEKTFDFSDREFFLAIDQLSKKIQSSDLYKGSKRGRGSRHGLYVNRTYFGLYNLLHLLGAEVNTSSDWDVVLSSKRA